MLREWLRVCFVSSGSLFGVYIAFGLLMGRIEALNAYFIGGTLGRIGMIITGFIGTVVHEFSHFLMCLVFRHQVVEVAWFRPIQGMQDGVLGYVRHQYNPKDWYQQIGNFFIGIAPLLVGSIVILLLFKIFLPSISSTFTSTMNSNIQQMNQAFSVGSILKLMGKQTKCLFKGLFTKKNMTKPIFWVFLFSVYSISTHMSLSLADLRGAAVGLMFMIGFIMFLSAVLTVLHIPLKKLAPVMVRYNSWVITIFSIGLSFSLLTLGVSGIGFLIFGINR